VTTAVADPAGRTTRHTYDDAGRLTSVTDALGTTTMVHCDAAGLPVEVTDPADGTTRLEGDALGRLVRITNPAGGVTRFVWDADGNLAQRVEPGAATTSWTYDGEGNRLTHTDPVGGVTRFEYTHFDLLAARTYPDGARYEFEHDAALRLTKVTNPHGLQWTYTYDAAGRLTSETDFGGRALIYRREALELVHGEDDRRLGARNAAELMTLSAELQAGGIQLELLTGPLSGIYDPNGMGAMFFAVLAVAGQIEHNYIREKTLEGQVIAASKGNHGGRPKVIDDDMLTFAVALKDKIYCRSRPASQVPLGGHRACTDARERERLLAHTCGSRGRMPAVRLELST
jgi:YD repeat-containing protein